MLYIETWNVPGDINMAFDIVMGKYSAEKRIPVFRFYTWEKPTLSVGKHQDLRGINLDVLKKLDIPCVRRPTGGRAVLHFHEITYSVVFPAGSEEYNLKVLQLYKLISELFKSAFINLGYPVELGRGKGSLKNPSCFSSSARYELLLEGKKFLGSAQGRFKDFVLQHGSILLKVDHSILKAIFGDHVKENNFTGLHEYKKMPVKDIMKAILKSLKTRYDLKFLSWEEQMRIFKEAEKLRGNFLCRSST